MSNQPAKRRTKRSIVEEGFEWGMYVWKMPDNKILGNDGSVLNVVSMKGDFTKMAALKRFVNEELGIQAGEPFFMGGVERLSENEWEGQMEQMLDGKVPDRDWRSNIEQAKKQIKEHRGG